MNIKWFAFAFLILLAALLFVDKKTFCYQWYREINTLFQDNLLDVKGTDFVLHSKVNYYSSCDVPTGLEEVLWLEQNQGFRPF